MRDAHYNLVHLIQQQNILLNSCDDLLGHCTRDTHTNTDMTTRYYEGREKKDRMTTPEKGEGRNSDEN